MGLANDTSSPGKTLSPIKLAHIVLRTTDVPRMVEYYKNFLGARIAFANDRAAFLGYDDEHHRIGLVKYDNLQVPKDPMTGIEHIAFTFANLNDLVTAYEQRKALGITPVECMNHGPTMSLYYDDPDGNRLETQVDSFSSAEEAHEFVKSPDFAENPVGVDFDPEDLLRRVRSGEDEKSILKRPVTGPRFFPMTVEPRV